MDTFSIYNISSHPNLNGTKENEDDDFIYRDFIYTFICTVATIANIFLICCLLRFKKMRIRRNLIILNWAIADLLHMIVNVLSFDLIPDTCGLSNSDEYFCGVFEIRSMLHTTTIIFVLWLLLDCTFKKCSRKCFISVIICIWVIVYLCMITSVALCIYDIYLPYSYTSLLIMFILLLLCVFLYCNISIVRKIKNVQVEDSTFRFSAAGMYVLCWLSNIICFYLSLFLHSKYLYNISKSVAIIGYMNVVINLFLFTLTDNNFRICFAHAFKVDSRQISYNENADVEFLYTSLMPPSVRNHPKPEKLHITTQSNLGTPV